MNMAKARGAIVAVLVLLALIVTACGGGSVGTTGPGGADGPAGADGPGADGADPGGSASQGGAGTDDGDTGDSRSPGQVSGLAAAFCAALDDNADGAAQREIWTEHRSAVLEAVEAALSGQQGADAVDAVTAAIPCLLVEPRGRGPDLLIIGLPEAHEFDVTAQQNIIAWPWDGGWRLELLQLPLDDPMRVVLRVMPGGQSTELIIAQYMQGTGGYGAFELYRAGSELERLWESETHWKFAPHLLSDGRLLATYRSPQIDEEPHYFTANCCAPINAQTIYERDGDRYVEVASRLYPGVHYTASLFAGAINAGDYDLAASLVADELLLQVLVGADGGFEPIDLGEPPALAWDIDYYESWHWDALGPDSGDLHAVTEVRWEVPSHDMTMVLERLDDGWKIVGWE